MIAMARSRKTGSNTPLAHESSSILFVISRRIAGPPNVCVVKKAKGCQPASAAEGRLAFPIAAYCPSDGVSASVGRRGPAIGTLVLIAAYHPRCVPDCVCFGGHTAAPHHLSGPPLPATAVLEIGTTVAAPIVSAAAASAIASNVFIDPTP